MKTLKDYFRESGVSQSEAAKMLGLRREYLNRQINGKKSFRWSQVVFLCRLLDIENPLGVFPMGCTIDELYGKEG